MKKLIKKEWYDISLMVGQFIFGGIFIYLYGFMKINFWDWLSLTLPFYLIHLIIIWKIDDRRRG